MKLIKKISALILAAAIIFTGCSGSGASWAFKSGDDEIPVGLYMLYELDAFYDANQQLQKEFPDDTSIPTLTPQEILKKTIEGKKASEWIAVKAQERVREHIAVSDKFKELGLELTETEVAYGKTSAADLMAQTNSKFYTDNGISEQSMIEYYTNYVKTYRVFMEIYGEGGTQAIPESELKDYLKTHYAMIDLMVMYKEEATGASEVKMTDAETKAAAEEYVKRLEAGEEIEELYYEWAQKNADEETKDLMQKPEKGNLTMVISENDRESLGNTVVDALMGMDVGKTQLIDDTGLYLVAQRKDILADETVFTGYKTTLLQEIKYEEFMGTVTQWGAEKQLETNNTVVNRHNPDNIDFKNVSAS